MANPQAPPPAMLTFADFNRPERLDEDEGPSRRELHSISRTATLTNNTPDHSRQTSQTRLAIPRSRASTLTNDMPDHSCRNSQTLLNKLMSRNSSMERRKEYSSSILTLTNQAKNTHRYLSQELAISYMGAPVLLCFFTSGLVDSVAFNSWNCFVGMQTGNTIFAALGLSGQPAASHNSQYYKSLVSIGAFCLGTLFFSALHRLPTSFHEQPSSRRRWVFLLSFFLQAIFIIIAATMVTLNLVSDRPYISGVFSSGTQPSEQPIIRHGMNYLDLCPIALLAFAAAGQVTLSRTLALIELPTIVLSTLFHDFTADLYNLRNSWGESTSLFDFVFNAQRRQEKRLFAILALFLGGVVGGEMYKSHVGMSGALWLAAACKLGISVAFLVWKKDRSEEWDGDNESTSPC